MILWNIPHERGEAFYPREMLIPVKHLDGDWLDLCAEVDGLSGPSLIVQEREDIEVDLLLVLRGGDVFHCHRILDPSEVIFREEMTILGVPLLVFAGMHQIPQGQHTRSIDFPDASHSQSHAFC